MTRNRTTQRRAAIATVVAGSALALSGCSFTGPNSYALPFSKGGGSDAVNMTVLLENSTNLVPNSEVKYKEVTVGSVRKIELDGWTAKLSVGLEKDAKVPADVVAKVAQKSLLGAEYLELKDPQGSQGGDGPEELLADGDTIGLDRTQRYPETEEVLTAASLLLNGGGLPQIQTISKELNAALTGNTQQVTDVVAKVDEATGKLDAQRDQITGALEQLNNLSGTLNADQATLERALDTLPQGVRSLDENLPELQATLESFTRIERVSRTALGETGEALGRTLNNLIPITQALVDKGSELPKALELITYPFPAATTYKYTRSDYLNLFATFQISPGELAAAFLGVTSLDGLMAGVLGAPTGTATGSADPLAGTAGQLAASGGDVLGLGRDGLFGQLAGETQPGDSATGAAPGETDPNAPERPPRKNLIQQLLGGQ